MVRTGRRRAAAIAVTVFGVVSATALAVFTNLATEAGLPDRLVWLGTPAVAWGATGLLVVVSAALSVFLASNQTTSLTGSLTSIDRWPVFSVPNARTEDVPRPDVVQPLLNLLGAAPGVGAVAVTTALAGAGGFGKTTVARMLIHLPQVRRLLPDGVLWITLGEDVEGPGLAERINEACAAITGVKPPFTDPFRL